MDDVPKFLNGPDQENSLHICIKYYDNPNRKKQLEKIKSKIIELKKSIVYSKTIDNKIVEIELNTPRTFRSNYSGMGTENDALSTYRSLNNFEFSNNFSKHLHSTETNENLNLLTNRSDMPTNRTVKSVRFDDEDKKDNKDYLTDKAVKKHYKHLIDLVSKRKKDNFDDSMGNSSSLNETQELSVFSLSLPLTPRSIQGYSLADSDRSHLTDISKPESKSLESIYDKINSDFLKE